MSSKAAYQMRGRELGMIFQEPLTRLNPLMRISQHFEETIKQHEPDLSKDEIRQRALEVLRLMGIPPTRYGSYPHEFSGGMRQRLMIALHWCCVPHSWSRTSRRPRSTSWSRPRSCRSSTTCAATSRPRCS